ncbi:MAG: ATP-dependent sacrificial sulfur transferase LarE [Desulfobacteraceae bacterium]|nr:MAG: ATP-dependent sacrificial sulfur transferase LarE [Desulfobacteraceae bacterium]
MFTEDQMILEKKHIELNHCLKKFASLGVAFSGGVDSSLLLAAARQVLGARVIAFTAHSEVHPAGEKEAAIEIARQMGVQHVLFASGEMDDPAFTANPSDRCYHCKKGLLKLMWAQADALGVQALAHGANLDDLSDFRPGFKATEEMGIAAPLIEAGLSKADVRGLAKRLGLSNWDRPAMACLATRIPYGTPIQGSALSRIDKAEAFIRRLGAIHCRVRHHGNLARIEIDPNAVELFAGPRIRGQIVSKLRELGYAHICLDLEGYASGKMNRDIGHDS